VNQAAVLEISEQPDRTVQEDVITIRSKEIRVRTAYVKQTELKFYPENPRIYSSVWKDDVTPTQREIFDALSKMEHVREVLVPSIRQNGGLIEPILVRGDVVLEGNSRLAAYRLLEQAEPGKWRHIRVRILPDSMTESEVFTLLGEYHIVGKKDWQPYEQAGYLYRRFKKHGVTEDELKAEVGLPPARIRHLIRVYEFMLEHDRNPSRWSYYDELLKGTRFNKARELYPKFDEVIVRKIQSEEIERAVDVRDALPLIAKAGGNTLKKFMSGALSFPDAVHDARQRGAGDYNFKTINKFRLWLVEDSLDEEFGKAPQPERRRLSFELDKIERRIKTLQRRLTAKE
jgi:hypothetical protein